MVKILIPPFLNGKLFLEDSWREHAWFQGKPVIAWCHGRVVNPLNDWNTQYQGIAPMLHMHLCTRSPTTLHQVFHRDFDIVAGDRLCD